MPPMSYRGEGGSEGEGEGREEEREGRGRRGGNDRRGREQGGNTAENKSRYIVRLIVWY